MRTPVDDLGEQFPELALGLDEVQKQLRHIDATARPNAPAVTAVDSIPDVRVMTYAVSASGQYQKAVIQYDKLLQDIRNRDGFEDFMRPKRLAGFTSSPAFTSLNTITVFINVAPSSCDALVLLPSGVVEHVKLPELTEECAEDLRARWTAKVRPNSQSAQGRRDIVPPEQRAASQGGGLSTYEDILGHLWTRVVSPVLLALDLVSVIFKSSVLVDR